MRRTLLASFTRAPAGEFPHCRCQPATHLLPTPHLTSWARSQKVNSMGKDRSPTGCIVPSITFRQ
ncbi:hypothetical protein BRADI_2g32584v3 [Brachypodium distachyon]|uniref:Uncharacterized protein n=1 Tax=Brachypodium distachyon TaxID=15368 RepID=A0A2K2DBG3_BRADI|nr:hypothetical protein BRADI_2g32584v3 [Brachypodium distachyon]